jgi:hypothetical protein
MVCLDVFTFNAYLKCEKQINYFHQLVVELSEQKQFIAINFEGN